MNLMKKMLAVPAAVLALWAVTAQATTDEAIAERLKPVGDTAAWKDRADHQGGLDGILAKAISGINAMPPKGTCADCSDDELREAIKKMSGL